MQIQNIRKEFDTFVWKFYPFERDSKCSNANSNHSKGIQSISMQIRTFERDLKHLYTNSHPSNEIRSIRMLLLSIRTRFEALECIFEPFERDSNANSNANSNHSNQI